MGGFAHVGVTQKSAWFMMHRLRNALQQGSLVKLDGSGAPIEVDETFIGGKARNMHRDRRARCIQGTGGNSKTIVMGMLQRGGKVKAVMPQTASGPPYSRSCAIT